MTSNATLAYRGIAPGLQSNLERSKAAEIANTIHRHLSFFV